MMKSSASEIKTGVTSERKTGNTAVKAVAGKVAATSRPVATEKPEKRAASTETQQLEAGKVVAKTAPRSVSAAAKKVTAKTATETTTKSKAKTTTRAKAEVTPTAAVKAIPKSKAAQIELPAVKPVEHGDEEIRRMIATAAYYRAEKRGFAVGHEREDWLMAEKEVNQILTSGS
jgi:hypothetical protein